VNFGNGNSLIINTGIYRTVSYFSGQILNRFSKDMGSVDEFLPHTLIDCVQVCKLLFQYSLVMV
jgi:hypothetical protein